MVDTAHFARAAGNRRAQNMVMVGAASPMLDFEEDRLLALVEKLFARKGEKIVAVNQRAFRFGRAAGQFFHGLFAAGVSKRDALQLVGKFDPETIDGTHTSAWAEAIGNNGACLAAVLSADKAVACDQIVAYT
jgi:indolepyruvate ferredoxin oxidoreductase beta subunit